MATLWSSKTKKQADQTGGIFFGLHWPNPHCLNHKSFWWQRYDHSKLKSSCHPADQAGGIFFGLHRPTTHTLITNRSDGKAMMYIHPKFLNLFTTFALSESGLSFAILWEGIPNQAKLPAHHQRFSSKLFYLILWYLWKYLMWYDGFCLLKMFNLWPEKSLYMSFGIKG